jgi:hypothetical protein
MAGEISITGLLRLANGLLSAQQQINGTADQATANARQFTQSIATSETTISFTGVTAARWVAIKNTDATNYVDVGPDSTGLVGMIRLLAGESCVLPLKPSTTIKAQANSASVVISILALET